MAPLYKDRREAGRTLARAAKGLATERPIVLAIPRGGVVVAVEMATELKADLDLVVPRKLGAPHNEELAIGAVMHDGTAYLNDEVLRMTGADDEYIRREKERQVKEAQRRLVAYRGTRPYPSLKGRTVIVVDDGVATGATMIVALRWARAQGTARVVAAAPVAPRETLEVLKQEADVVICPATPEPFYAIGQFYEHFDQVEDEQVIALLRDCWERNEATARASS